MRQRLQVPLLGFMAGAAVGELNISSTALVNASRGLGMSPELVPIAASALSIVLAATVISGGLLADRIGRRRLLMWALGVGIAGDLATAACIDSWMFIAGRIAVGVSLGIVFTASFTMVRAVSAPEKLGSSLGLFGAVSGISMMACSFVGGSLATVQWRAAFLVLPVMFFIAFLLVPRILPVEQPVGSGPIDALGQVLLAIGIIGPLYAVSQLTTSFTAPRTLISFGVGVIALIAFYVWESRTPHPFFPVRIFREPVFIACILMSFCVNMSNSVLVLQLSNLWQYVRRMDTVDVAVAQLPALIMGVIASIIAGKLLAHGWRERRVGLMGFTFVFAGFATLALYRVGAPFVFFLPALILVGGGAQVINVPFGSLLMKVAPKEYIGPVTASRSSVGSFANALGMAGTTVLISRFTRSDLLHELGLDKVSGIDEGQALNPVTVYIRSGAIPADSGARHLLVEAGAAYSYAFSLTMGIVAAVVAIMGITVLWLLRRRVPASATPAVG